MNIIGVSVYYHDSAAAIVVDGEIIAAAQEKCFSLAYASYRDFFYRKSHIVPES